MQDAVAPLLRGDIDDALGILERQVRAAPEEARLRVFLFQLLAVQGDWPRAAEQLQIAGELDAGALGMVQVYREALRCEQLRADVFAGHIPPMLVAEPEPWMSLLIEALELQISGYYAQSQQLRSEAFDKAPVTLGQIDGTPFRWLADADSRFGPMLECILNGQYFWVPVQWITRLEIEAPTDLRDVVWMPCHLAWLNGGEASGLIPTRYPDTERSDDPFARLARITTWRDLGAAVFVGSGQRMLATDHAEYPLMEIRRIDITTTDAGARQQAEPATAGG